MNGIPRSRSSGFVSVISRSLVPVMTNIRDITGETGLKQYGSRINLYVHQYFRLSRSKFYAGEILDPFESNIEGAAIFKADESAVEQVVDVRRQQQSIFSVQPFLV